MKKKQQMFEFVLTAVFAAIILVMSLVPNLGFITILPGVSITLIHIPVIIGITILGLRSSLILGLFFGLGSLMASYMYAVNPFDLTFQYPWISILPRVLFALITFYIVKLFKMIFTLKNGKYILFSIVTVVTVAVVFVGFNSTFEKIIYNKYNVAKNELVLMENDKTTDPEDLLNQTIKVEALLQNADELKERLQAFIIPIVIVVIIALLALFYIATIVKNSKYSYIPSIFVIATIVHSILVLGAVSLFQPKIFLESVGNNNSIVAALFIFVLINGFVEALFGAILATPVTIAVSKRLEDY